jgi:hypothetical protein
MKPAYLMGKFFKTCADHFQSESEHHSVMSEGWDENSKQAASHADRAEKCSKLAKTCSSLADKCGKAESAADFEKLFGDAGDELRPTGVSIIAPTAPAKKLTAVPRFGAPPMPTVEPDSIFGKIFGDLGTEE